MRIFQSQRLPVLFATLAALLAHLTAAEARAQDAVSPRGNQPSPVAGALGPSDVRQIYVPANQPQTWPKGDWEIVGSQEYRRLLEGLNPKAPEPSPAKIRKATYRAMFTGKHLGGGQLTATVQQTSRQRYLSLDPINLALASLWWEEDGQPREAIWGNAAAGQTLLVLPHPNSTSSNERILRGEWSAAGRQFSKRCEFDLKFLPATVTELELFVPVGWTPKTSVGYIEGPFELPQNDQHNPVPLAQRSGVRLWNVQLGSERECQLSLHRSNPGQQANALLLAESDTTYLIRERELQVEARYELDAAFAPLSQVVFDVPQSIRVFSVTYAGEPNVEWQIRTQGARQHIVIQLPDPLLGKSRPLRLHGLGRVESNGAWELPTITCRDAALLRGELHLTVDAPLELRSYQAEGFRQTGISVQPDQRETLTFSQIASDSHARLTAFIGTPAFSTAAQIVSGLTTGTEEWQMRSEVNWLVQAGTQFETHCEILPGWEILDVRRASGATTPVIADWRVTPAKNGQPARLRIEFLEALTPMQSKRVLVLARRLPLTFGQSLSLACVKPLKVRSVEQFLAVHSSKSDILISDPESEVTRWTSQTLPGFVQQSPLISSRPVTPTRTESQFFYSKNSTSDPQLILNTGEPPYEAEVDVLLEYNDDHILETLRFAIEPLDTPIDRLSVFATELGEGWKWELQTEQRIPMASPIQLATEPAALPDEGEGTAWELRLPEPQTKPFELIATRQREAQSSYRVVLPFLPAAHALESTVKLKTPKDLAVDLRTTALAEAPNPKGIEGAGPTRIRQWSYRSPEASLMVELFPQDAVKKALMGRLTMLSLINGFNQSAIHFAQYNLEPHPQHTTFSVRIPNDAKLIDVLLDGKAIPARAGDDGLIRLGLRSQKNYQIEIRYESTWGADGMVSPIAVPIPQTNMTVLEYVWNFGLSPDLELSDAPDGLSLTTAPPAIHWTTRFFGPLGRGSRGEAFRPWVWADWESLFTVASADENRADASSELFPVNWKVYEARGPRVDPTVHLRVWNRPLGYRWAWIVFLGTVMVGFAVRMRAATYRRQLGVFWFLMSLAGASLLPMPWAMLAGGSLTATLIAMLFPRRWLVMPGKRSRPVVPAGSTASFQHQPVITLTFLVLAGLGTLAFCVLGLPQAVQGQPSPTANEAEANSPPFNVMIPAENPRNPEPKSSVVYVDRAFLKRLRNVQPAPDPPVTYLISSAKYAAQVDSQNAVEISAEYEVVVLTPHQSVSVHLPIENAFPGGPGHCRVDGRPHPILLDPQGTGYVVGLAPKAPNLSGHQAAVAEKPRSTVPEMMNLEARKIALRLHASTKPLPHGGQFTLSVPAVSASEFHVELPEAFASIGLRGLPGQLHSATQTKSFHAEIGAAKKLELFWSHQPNGPPSTGKQAPSVFALATVYPLRVEWQIRVKSVPKTGLSSPTWHLPANTLVREVKSERLLSYDVQAGNDGTRLLMEFQEPLLTDFTVDLTCMTARVPSSSAQLQKVEIPALDLFADLPQSPLGTEIEYQIGVASTPELALDPLGPDFLASKEIQSVTPEKFLSGYRLGPTESQTLRAPQYAWKLARPTPLPLSQQPRLPTRRARLTQEGRIRQKELRWSFTAEIDTATATAFRHTLRVPKELIVDSVSVQEDETERLVRWSQLGTRLELVLSDGTNGSQSVTLTGRQPIELEAGNQIPLPLIQVENAEIVDSRLRIYQDHHATHKLQVTGVENEPVLDANGLEMSRGIPRLLVGVYLTNTEKTPVLAVGGPLQKLRLDRATFLTTLDSSRYQVATLIHLVGELDDSPQRLTLHLPAAMTREFRVEFSDRPGEIVPYETAALPDQSLELVFESMVLNEGSILQIDSVIDGLKPGPWSLPLVDVSQAEVEDSLLALSPAFTVQTSEQNPPPQTLSREEIPDWILEHRMLDPDVAGLQVFRDPQQSWLIVSADSSVDETSTQPAIHTNLWLMDSKKITGQTYVQIPTGTQETMAWHWPEQITLRGALLDGTPLSPILDSEDQTLQFTLPVTGIPRAGSQHRTLEIHWSHELAKPLPRFGQLEFLLPKPQSEDFESATLTVLPPHRTRLIAEQGFDVGTSAELATVLEAPQNSLAGKLPLHGDAWSLSFWTMDVRAERVLLMCLFVLALGGIMHWGLRLNTGDWLHRHQPIAWGLLGLLWWVGLVGSVLGFGLLLLCPILSVVAWFRPSKSSRSRPSTVG